MWEGTGRFFPLISDPLQIDRDRIRRTYLSKAVENKDKAVSGGRTSMELANAEIFAVPENADRMYFFNPFSVEILEKVMARILESYYQNPRAIQLFFTIRQMNIYRI